MALNPIAYTEKIVSSFLKYQLTAYPFTDERLHTQMRELLSMESTRQTPLLKGPYISLSRAFRAGSTVDALISEDIFHPHMRQIIPGDIQSLYGHQDEAIRRIHEGRPTLISTGTGSGKSECFLYPIISRCLTLRDQGAPPGITAVIVYPMNALAEDQLGRLRALLAGSGVTFGMYVGKTPGGEHEVSGHRMPLGSSRSDYLATLQRFQAEGRAEAIHPAEEVCSRELMRTPGRQPRILLTNVKQLELLLTRQRDVALFDNASLDFLVFDEAHTFTGAQGAETACLIRRLRAFCGREADQTVCIATSATIVDDEQPDAARLFASRFFGVPKDDVATVGEAYDPTVWPDARSVPPAPRDPQAALAACLKAVDESEADQPVRAAYRLLTGSDLPAGIWSEALHTALSSNELVYQINALLSSATAISELEEELQKAVGRPVSEAEVLAWLTLGAAAGRGDRPLLRPVVHGFIRGIPGAVVSFPKGSEPRLWLAAEDEIAHGGDVEDRLRMPVTSCTVCGQHYFETHLKDFIFTSKAPEGGEAAGGAFYWPPLDVNNGGRRVVVTDRIVGQEEDAAEEHKRTSTLHFCRACGAAHPGAFARCLGCGRDGPSVVLYAIQHKADNPGRLTSCLCCGSTARTLGARYREPARPVRATNVSDVHVLAQDMIHHAQRRRLLVFADNRQDAAFQAGWMSDHARRFRLRALMYEQLQGDTLSVGDLTSRLCSLLDADDTLSRALIPEVWKVQRKEGGGGQHAEERKTFLRLQILREITTSPRQALGLEPWGRLKVSYTTLSPSSRFIQYSSAELGIPAEDLCEGIAAILDYLRRNRALYDHDTRVFSTLFKDGDKWIQSGYIPQLHSPVGTKFRREPGDKEQYSKQWLSDRGETVMRQIARKWRCPDVPGFLESLWDYLRDEGSRILIPAELKGNRGTNLSGSSGLYQIDVDQVRLSGNHGAFRCRTCRRRSPRRTPHLKCLAWHCNGELEFQREDSEDYNLQLLDGRYDMIRPAEHTAMVPNSTRERLEIEFKGDSERVNCLVCTQTLEMGVDIGALDAILMRNVPPLPANYWQRAGRAGRRHRMAVDLTYCRPISHDRAYFAEPLKMLEGRVDPPSFNLRNELLVAKHVHATVLTRLHQLARPNGRLEPDQAKVIADTLKEIIPSEIKGWLFNSDGTVRDEAFDVSALGQLINQHVIDLEAHVRAVFRQGWPEADADITDDRTLRALILSLSDELQSIILRLRRRLRWAQSQLKRLTEVEQRMGALSKDDEHQRRRCTDMVRRMKGESRRGAGEAEGYDDIYTYGVLAAEGFLPGYGLESGSIMATAEMPFGSDGPRELFLPRPPSVALREYVPGNLIYSNGQRFVARIFRQSAEEGRSEAIKFEVSTEREAVKETTGPAMGALGSSMLPAITVCDVDLVHRSHISDEEDTRFQLGVATYGHELDHHGGGQAFKWGPQTLHLRRAVRMRLVNAGATIAMNRATPILGYPLCLVCGQSRSPLSSDAELDDFRSQHKERCGRPVQCVGFYSDVIADAITLPRCRDRTQAYSILEALRMAAASILDMHIEDLQILVIGHVDRDTVDGVLWDPMPGGSGLLDQLCQRFDEVVQAAAQIIDLCPQSCPTSCVDCLQTFRNAFYHRHLDRHVASEFLAGHGNRLEPDHAIPERSPRAVEETETAGMAVNEAERMLKRMLEAAGFPTGIRDHQLPAGNKTTTPDVVYRVDEDDDALVCIYLDGLSRGIHGSEDAQALDHEIRSALRSTGHDVIEIAASELGDPSAMTRHFKKLARYLGAEDVRQRVQQDATWYQAAEAEPNDQAPFDMVPNPDDSEKFRTCVPLLSLEAAAGAFGDAQPVSFAEWVRPRTGRVLSEGMFVARVVGKSMEPRIPDGSYALFKAPVTGSRSGRIVLVQLHDQTDPETGGRYTVKRYESEKTGDDRSTWRHTSIRLVPENRDFETIELTADDETSVAVIAEVVEVLGTI